MIKYKLKNTITRRSVIMVVPDTSREYETRLFTGKLDKNGREIYDDDLMISDKGIVCRVFWSSSKDRWAVMYRISGEKLYYKSLAWASKNCEITNEFKN